MMLSLRVEKKPLRKALSLGVSACLHASVVAWIAMAPILLPDDKPLYNRVIRPNTDRILYYSLRDQLPAISPDKQPRKPDPPRALRPFSQTLVAGPSDTKRPPQLIYTPAPELDKPQLLPSPNVITFAPARPQPRPFVAPEEQRPRSNPAVLPAAPQMTEAMANRTAPSNLLPPLQPARKTFVPPAEAKHQTQAANLEAAPELKVAMANATATSNLLPPIQAARKTFVPPVEAKHQPQATANLEAAPNLPQASKADGEVLPALPMAKPRRTFTAPQGKAAPQAVAVNLPAAPSLPQASNVDGQVLPAALPMAKPRKTFTAPERKTVPQAPTPTLSEAPQVSEGNRTPAASLAIASIVPTATPDIPKPKASQQAGFSAGPTLRFTGGDDVVQPTQLVVPGLLSRSNPAPGPNDPPQVLVGMLTPAASSTNRDRTARTVQPDDPPPDIEVINAVRLAKPPDPRLEGRVVYLIAIQMANISSSSGGWTLWFAAHDPAAGRPEVLLKPPVPLRKVEPKEVPPATGERVDGKVRFAAVIRKDGHVDAVELLRGLDTNLDRSAAEALSKWEFEPSRLNGDPIELDAIFDIPFRVAGGSGGKRAER